MEAGLLIPKQTFVDIQPLMLNEEPVLLQGRILKQATTGRDLYPLGRIETVLGSRRGVSSQKSL